MYLSRLLYGSAIWRPGDRDLLLLWSGCMSFSPGCSLSLISPASLERDLPRLLWLYTLHAFSIDHCQWGRRIYRLMSILFDVCTQENLPMGNELWSMWGLKTYTNYSIRTTWAGNAPLKYVHIAWLPRPQCKGNTEVHDRESYQTWALRSICQSLLLNPRNDD